MEKKLKLVDIISEYGLTRKVVNKNNNTVIIAFKGIDDKDWNIVKSVKYPKCAKKEPWDYFIFNKQVNFPYMATMVGCLKEAQNAMKKDCAQSLIEFHTKRVTNITKLL